MNSFKKIGSFLFEDKFPSTLYKSDFSGCQILLVDYTTPILKAELSIATVHENNDGIAHALEHLIFHGSKNYPYHDNLRKFAERVYSFVNAHTDSSKTAYNLSSVGSEGFLKVLPVFLDSIFYPLLLESSFKTEVHHVNGEGKHGGVVYSEMLQTKFSRKLNQLIYGENSTFAYSIGGLPNDIIKNCTLEKIRDYHKKYYHMENMFITIVGTVAHEKVLDAVETFQQTNNLARTGYLSIYKSMVVKPFQQTVERVTTPSEAKTGIVHIQWRGDSIWNADMHSLQRLACYFANKEGSVLHDKYVNSTSPVCASVETEYRVYNTLVFGFCFNFVNPAFLAVKNEHLFCQSLLSLIRNHTVDLTELRKQLFKYIHQSVFHLEKDIFSKVCSKSLRYQNYAPKDNMQFISTCNVADVKKMMMQDADYWQALIKKYFTEDYIVLIFMPTAKVEMGESESIKPEDLKKYALELEEAVAETESRQPPAEMFDKFNIDITNDLYAIPVERSIKMQKFGESDDVSSDASVIVHKTPSSFATIKFVFDIQDIPETFKPLVPLFANLADLDIKNLDADIMYTAVTININFIVFEVGVFPEKAGRVSDVWAKYFKEMTFDRNTIEDMLRNCTNTTKKAEVSGKYILIVMGANLVTEPESVSNYQMKSNLLRYYEKLLKNMEDGRFVDDFVNKLEQLRDFIHQCRFNMHYIGDPSGIQHIHFEKLPSFNGCAELRYYFPDCTSYSQSAGKTHCIVNKDWSASYLQLNVHAPFDHGSTQYIYSALLNIYLYQTVMSKVLRGNGYAYHAQISTYANEGITVDIDRASNLVGAYTEIKKAIADIVISGKVDEKEFENAKNKRIKQMLESEANIYKAGLKSFTDHSCGCNPNEKMNLINFKVIKEAVFENVLQSVGKYYLDLFDDSKNVKAIVAPLKIKKDIELLFPNVEFKSVADFYKDIPLWNNYS